MDIHSRHTIEDKKNENAVIGTREEIFKQILADAKVIEATEVSAETLDVERVSSSDL